MAYYSSKEQLQNDFHWLGRDCTLEHFAYSRLSDYDFENLAGQLSQRLDDPFIEDVFNQFLSKLSLQSTMWEDTLTRSMLPALALIPGIGMQVIFDIDVNGEYKSITSSGAINNQSFPENTIFRMLKFKTKKKSLNSSFSMFKSIARKQKKYLYYVMIASVSINLLALGVAFYTMQVYDRVISSNGISTLIALTIGVGIAITLEMLLKYSKSSILNQAKKNMDIEYSYDIFDRFLKVRSDNVPLGIGSLSNKISSYTSVRAFIVDVIIFLTIDFPFAFFFLGIVTLIGGLKIGFLILAFVLVEILIGFSFKEKIEVLTKALTMAVHKKHGLLVETIENAHQIKSSGASWSVMNKWNQHTEDATNDEIHIAYYNELTHNLSVYLQQLAYVSTVAFGAYLIGSSNDLTMGSLIAITILTNKIFTPMMAIPNHLVRWATVKVNIQDLDSLYKMAGDNENVDIPITSKLASHSIECDDLRYSYTKDETFALNIGNLKIQPGERVAILGTIGAGKSTLLKMLSGLFKPSVGRVLLDGIDMQQLSRNNITNTIGYLEQDTKLFEGTLRNNLTFGLVNVTDEKIIEVSKLTGLITLISGLPSGLDSIVPEGGKTVSGGQRQLIALTRMLIGESRVVLLDEPTANMDDSTERHLLLTLHQNITKEQTLIVVTHKPNILSLVDRIIILSSKGIVADDKKEVILEQLKNNKEKQNNHE